MYKLAKVLNLRIFYETCSYYRFHRLRKNDAGFHGQAPGILRLRRRRLGPPALFQEGFYPGYRKTFSPSPRRRKVNKRALRNIVFNDNARLKELESLIHPFLRQYLKKVIHRQARGDGLFFLDVALLFEMGWDIYCDCIIVANVDYETQKMRVMKRDGITGEDFDKINDIQMSNSDKIALADVVIDTGRSQNQVFTDLISIIDGLEC